MFTGLNQQVIFIVLNGNFSVSKMSGLVFRMDPRTLTKKRSDRLKKEVDQEERFEKVAYGHVQNERVGFTKVGNRLKRAVTPTVAR